MFLDHLPDPLGEFIQWPCLAGFAAEMALALAPVAANLLFQEGIPNARVADVCVVAVVPAKLGVGQRAPRVHFPRSSKVSSL
jgi:hypothetical protein